MPYIIAEEILVYNIGWRKEVHSCGTNHKRKGKWR